jgi:hypothetical protein
MIDKVRSRKTPVEIRQLRVALDSAHNSVLDAIQSLQTLERKEKRAIRLRSLQVFLRRLNYLDGSIVQERVNLSDLRTDRPSTIEQTLDQIRKLQEVLVDQVRSTQRKG